MTTGPVETAKAYEEPSIRQFSAFVPNLVGQLRSLVDLFVGQGVHIVALDVIDSIDWAVVRMIFSDSNKARAILQRAKWPFTECQMLAVELPSPDALAGLARALLAAELNLHVIYPLLVTAHGRAVVAVHVDDSSLATQVLKARGFTLLDQSDIWTSGTPES